jgi:RHS repeat-associated protein
MLSATTHSTRERVLALALVLSILSAGCGPGFPAAEPGMPQYQSAGFLQVPGGTFNVAGLNLFVPGPRIDVDTPVGTEQISPSYNSADGRWHWNVDTAYDGDEFLDPSGARYDVSGLPDGAAIPGTVWVVVDSDTIRTKGGQSYHFDPQGRLEARSWAHADHPRLAYLWAAGELRIRQCLSPAVPVEQCTLVFTATLGAHGPTRVVDERSAAAGGVREAGFSYDFWGRLATARSPSDVANGRAGTSYEYELWPGSLLTATTRSEGERVEYDWQAGRRLGSIIQRGEGDPLDSFDYVMQGSAPRLYTVIHTNPLGGETRFQFDGERRIVEEWRVGSNERSSLSWAAGARRQSAQTDFDGRRWEFEWLDDDPVEIRTPAGNVIQVSYAPEAVDFAHPELRPLAHAGDSIGTILDVSYDAQGRPVSSANGEGDTVSLDYTSTALASATDSWGATTSFTSYGQHGHWTDADLPALPIPIRRKFDAAGNLRVPAAGLQRGGSLERGYDADRWLASVRVGATDDGGHVVAEDQVDIARRSDGQILAIRRPDGADHVMEFDGLGRLSRVCERVDGACADTTLEWNALGLATAIEKPNGMREELEFDEYGRLLARRSYRDGVLEAFADYHWAPGRVVDSYDSLRDQWESVVYDAAGRPSLMTWSGYGETVALTYDLRSRVVGETYAVGSLTRELGFDWDLADRQKRLFLVDAGVEETLVEIIRQDGKQVAVYTGNGLERDVERDPISGIVTGFSTTHPVQGLVEQTTISRTLESGPTRLQISSATWTPLASTAEEYWLNRGGNLQDPDGLVGMRVFGWRDESGFERRYAWDELSNRVDDSGGDSFDYNAERNRLLAASVGGVTHTYAYDEAGYAISRDGAPIAWTATGRLSRYGPAASPLLEIEWDLSERPVSVSVLGELREFTLFGGSVEYDSVTGSVGLLHLGPVSLPFAGGERIYRHQDFRANTRFVSDQDGDVIAHHRYGPFGIDQSFGAQGFGADPSGFAGGFELIGTGLVLLGVRVLDSDVGRFLSPDPVRHRLNQYSYALGNPVLFWDPDGLQEDARAEVATGWQGAALGAVALLVTTLTLAAKLVAGVTGFAAFFTIAAAFAAAAGALVVFTLAVTRLIRALEQATAQKARQAQEKSLRLRLEREAQGRREALSPEIATPFEAAGGSFAPGGVPGFLPGPALDPGFPCGCCDAPIAAVTAPPVRAGWLLLIALAAILSLLGARSIERRAGVAPARALEVGRGFRRAG